MKIQKIFIASILLLALASSVSAYGGVYRYGDNNAYYNYYPRSQVGEFVLTSRPSYNYRYYDREDFVEFRNNVKKLRTAKFVEVSFNKRYDLTRGVASGEAFCKDCKDNDYAPTNWRYKDSFDLRNRNNDGNYYKPVLDSEKGYFNWRY